MAHKVNVQRDSEGRRYLEYRAKCTNRDCRARFTAHEFLPCEEFSETTCPSCMKTTGVYDSDPRACLAGNES